MLVPAPPRAHAVGLDVQRVQERVRVGGRKMRLCKMCQQPLRVQEAVAEAIDMRTGPCTADGAMGIREMERV